MAQHYLGNKKSDCGCSQLGSTSYNQFQPNDASFDVIIDEERENWQIDGGSDKDPIPDNDPIPNPQPPAMDEKEDPTYYSGSYYHQYRLPAMDEKEDPTRAPAPPPDHNKTGAGQIQPTSGTGNNNGGGNSENSVATKTTNVLKAGVTNPWTLGLLLLAALGYGWNHFQNKYP